MKRIDLAGSLLLELYRELWSIFQRNVSLKIDNDYKFHFKDFGNDIKNIILLFSIFPISYLIAFLIASIGNMTHSFLPKYFLDKRNLKF